MKKGQEITERQIVPSLDYWHERSGDLLNFFLAGWRKGHEWLFDAKKFVEACDVVASETSWTYSGGVDLLLFLTRTKSENEATADLNAVMCIRLHQLKEGKWGEAPEIIFERIYNFVKGVAPLFGLSLQETRVSAAMGVLDALLEYFPDAVRHRIRYAKEFTIQNVTKPLPSNVHLSLKRRVVDSSRPYVS
jgi:hypothetical protein